MISTLEPIWKQCEETYAAIRESLDAVPDDRLDWSVQPDTWSPSLLVQHIANANNVYSQIMAREPVIRRERTPGVSRAMLIELLDQSERKVRESFDGLAEDAAHEPLDDSWSPLGPRVEGPLDAIWFALQIVRHSAYHLGQLNYVSELGGFARNYE